VFGDPRLSPRVSSLYLADKRVRFEGNAVAGFNARGEIPVGRDAIERPTDCDKSGADGKR
jgi:hypothetical protein